jgi:exodeoxyribonuclease VII small subunit
MLSPGLLKQNRQSESGRSMENLSFEEAYARLETAVAALQDGQMPLEQALRHYEEGMKLAQHCNELLQKAELRVQQLSVDSEGLVVVQPLELS